MVLQSNESVHTHYMYYMNFYQVNFEGTLSYAQLWVNRVVNPVSCLVGIPVNLLIVVVFSLRDCGVPASVRFFYVVIAAMDLLSLAFYHLLMVIPLLFTSAWTDATLPMNNVPLCKISRWLWFSGNQCSMLATTTFCVERLLVISNPVKARARPYSRNCQLATLLLLLLSFAVNVYIIIGHEVQPMSIAPYRYCLIGFDSALRVVIANAPIYCQLLPSVAELLCNVLLAVKVMQLNRVHKHLAKQPSSSNSNSKDVTVAVALFTATGIRILVFTPDAVLWSVFGYSGELHASIQWIVRMFSAGSITVALCGLVKCSNFFVYFALIRNFRKQLINFLRCDCKHSTAR